MSRKIDIFQIPVEVAGRSVTTDEPLKVSCAAIIEASPSRTAFELRLSFSWLQWSTKNIESPDTHPGLRLASNDFWQAHLFFWPYPAAAFSIATKLAVGMLSGPAGSWPFPRMTMPLPRHLFSPLSRKLSHCRTRL